MALNYLGITGAFYILYFIGEGYLAGWSRQIVSNLAEQVPPNNFLFGGTCPAK